MLRFFKRNKEETRSVGSGESFTGQVMALRQDWLAGHAGVGELTSTVQSCVSLWEGALAASFITGDSDLLRRDVMAMAARSLALTGNSVWYISDDGLLPVSDYDFTTRDGRISAYRLTIPEASGGRSVTALASEVLHFKIGVDSAAPWQGTSPLSRSSLTAGLLEVLEEALREAYQNMPLGSSVVPFPSSDGIDLETLSRGMRGRRGRVLLRESVETAAQGSIAPSTDWRPSQLTPNLAESQSTQNLKAARDSVASAFGVPPAMLDPAAPGTTIREGQRHLGTWTVQPLAMVMAEEASDKLGSKVEIDVLRPISAYDESGRARAMATIIQGLALAKEAGVDAEQALWLVNWAKDNQDGAF